MNVPDIIEDIFPIMSFMDILGILIYFSSTFELLKVFSSMDYQPFRKKLRFINKENLHESISELSLYIMTDPEIAGM